jgi:hypothetical protein
MSFDQKEGAEKTDRDLANKRKIFDLDIRRKDN